METKIVVKIADMKIAKGEETLITYALGSCIGICLWDPALKLASLTHIMLPLNMEAGRKNTMKYADTGMKETIHQMQLKGAQCSRMVAKIAGGAKMFDVGGGGSLGNIGQRNIESVRMQLRRAGIRLAREEVGGTLARTLSFDAATGMGKVNSFGQPIITI